MRTMEVDGHYVKLQIWDTAGQVRSPRIFRRQGLRLASERARRQHSPDLTGSTPRRRHGRQPRGVSASMSVSPAAGTRYK